MGQFGESTRTRAASQLRRDLRLGLRAWPVGARSRLGSFRWRGESQAGEEKINHRVRRDGLHAVRGRSSSVSIAMFMMMFVVILIER